MCGRYVQTKRARDKARMFKLARTFAAQRAESWNVAPTTLALAVRLTTEGPVADWLTWGLQGSASPRPAFAEGEGRVEVEDRVKVEGKMDGVAERESSAPGEGAPFRPINARLESVAEKPYFRDAWKTRRCLIPADGWYEWKAEPDLPRATPRGRTRGRAGTRKQPYYFHRRDGEPLFLAALWTADTYSLITTPADGHLTQIHHRRPLTLRDDLASAWLASAPASPDQALATAIPPDAIAFHPVTPQVSNARQDGPDLIEQVTLDTRPELLPGF